MAELPAALRAEIQQGYRAFLAQRGLRPRPGQRRMIAAVANALAGADGAPGGPVVAVEAATGTGKTVAYLLAALPVARALGVPLVVATGTVSLQEQLLLKDVPELLAATGWSCRVALAKGRGRYLCNLRLEAALDAVASRDLGLALFPDEWPLIEPGDEALLRRLAEAFAEGRWDGDRDAWSDALPDPLWRGLTAERRQCAGPRCRAFRRCAFYRARGQLEAAQLIVANHDLVLADLELGGGVVLPAPERALYVFDEAHRLPEAALRHARGDCRLPPTLHWLEQVERALGQLAGQLGGDGSLAARAAEAAGDCAAARAALEALLPDLEALLPPAAGSAVHRFPLGRLPDPLRAAAAALAARFAGLAARLADLHEGLYGALGGHPSLPLPLLEEGARGVGSFLARAERLAHTWTQFAAPDDRAEAPRARWLERDGAAGFGCAVSPLSAGALLGERLWSRCLGAVLTSATLRALGRFDRFAQAAGLPGRAQCLAVAGGFDYARAAVLSVPDIGADGGDADAHTQALIRHLPRLLDPAEGSLVLFASRRQLEVVAAALQADADLPLLVQGRLPAAEILRRHRERIDAGQGSAIFGLASFAEGIDLPGDYCRHVVIAKLPFAVPDDPLQAAQAEWLEQQGKNPFRELSLPDASLRLAQACGRLLRGAADRGRITVLDRRLVTRSYGRELLAALPPFARSFEDDP
ncbi:MAG: ATP-dependent DNA helicase DinG [Porticoccaceae bacterium]|nr:MAG: ATP-dependent DNA helicase DinG [Porticoccaceae bacterium]